jgi:hypothetical protein
MDDLLAALEEETPTHRRATIGVGVTASTPSTTAPAASAVKSSVAARVIEVEGQIAELRAHGLHGRADEMAAALTQYLHSSVMGAGTVVDTPPPATARGGGFHFPSLSTGSEGATLAAKLANREFDAMNAGFVNLVQADTDIKRLRHTTIVSSRIRRRMPP